MNYLFELNWNELSEGLKEQKIDEWIEELTSGIRKGYSSTDLTEEDKKEMKKEIEKIENDREGVERSIEAHFPMYF